MNKNFFPLRAKINPTIYAYKLIDVKNKENLLKVGYTDRDAKTRVKEQIGATHLKFEIVLETEAIKEDGSTFSDHDVHRFLKTKGFENIEGEWFKCSLNDIKSAILQIKTGNENIQNRTQNFGLRPEQKEAIEKTAQYFKNYIFENPNKAPHFLWNAKMRFGKTFTTYKLAQKMNWNKILVLTFKPAVQNAWQEDLNSHVDFVNWQFISNNSLGFEEIDSKKPFVCFGSFQDYLGKNSVGGIKAKNEWVHSINWDCVVFDEYHYGAWRESAKELFEAEDDKKEKIYAQGEGIEYFDEDIMPITTKAYLYLSGTPFRAIESGEFIEEQIYNWTYSDEQKAKNSWIGENNPYSSLPRMVMLTYQLPDQIKEIALGGEFNQFDLNIFFSASGEKENAKFLYENEVQKWLDLIRGSFSETSIDSLKQGAKKPPLPFSDANLLDILTHTFWFLPTVSSCFAMSNLMKKRNNIFYHDYEIVVAAGSSAGIGVKALEPVQKAMSKNPLKTKTITLSCGKLTTGVSVKPWSGIFMLRNTSSPETYFQAAFRVQTPWTIKNPEGNNPNRVDILKQECYVFDFAPERALRQIAEYSTRLDINESNPEKQVAQFIEFLPVLAYDGSSMKQIDAAGILDIAMSGTTATLLARRWESALLVNVDNNTLAKIIKNENAMNALMNIEGFRSLNKDIETIINKSEAAKKKKKEANEKELTAKEKKELSDEEKEYKSLRKKIQEKLIKFATRIPVFMYLTDHRERSLKDIIVELEPALFKKVTGLNIKDFEILVSLGVFNGSLMNDAIYKFKRYEDSSLEYSGISKNQNEKIGLWDTLINKDDMKNL
ncbi:DEAD/DEAH box helicase family protein [Aliarcobacter cryaerophilus]|uniref:DEAD/DEAH box helicase family protein n=1 Tax=Aliarcobacter cryaerophilus TaxID=28198 RepID=UPI0021B38A23|nr:DEAD/DEAH box helicase family protein [Aliarcobacter cryaerophilus]MCT7507407.1 DEAD/DEAH box helicase family protein [Aliarcobacter cryaerophilus]